MDGQYKKLISERHKQKPINKIVMETTMPQLTEQYIKSLSDKEYQAYLIAKSHLGSSFDLEKSIGFLEWKKAQALSEKGTN